MKRNIIIVTFLCFLSILRAPHSFSKDLPAKHKDVYFIILAGGNGTRLWPLSRREKPKQFIAVGTKETLIDQAIDRISSLVPKENIWISTTKEHAENITRYAGNKIGNIVVEPGLRNTGPAILLGCMELYKHNPNASVIFLPADPFISNPETFISYVKQAINFTLTHDHITLIGLKPTYPATGYGYIEANKTQSNAPYPVKAFHEKPSLDVAKQYVQKDTMFWNAGMFCGKTSVFIDEFKKEAPEIFEGVSEYMLGKGDYNDVKSDSIDYAVMEKSKNIYVLPATFPWCDVGNIAIFLDIQKKHKQLDTSMIQVDAKNNLVKTNNKLVALVGIDNLCVVETDDVILVARHDQTEKVKEVVNLLKKTNMQKYL